MAGVALHEAIIKNTKVFKDQDHLSVVLATFPSQIEDRTRFLFGEIKENPAWSILDVIEKLLLLDVDVIGIPCNTSHAPEIFDQVQQGLYKRNKSVHLVHLPTEVISHLQVHHKQGCRVGLMATNGTYRSGFYQNQLKYNGYDVVDHGMNLQNKVIHKMIYDPQIGIKAQSVRITGQALALWYQALSFFKAEETEIIVLGCTELPLVLKHVEHQGILFIDTIEILARALIREAIHYPGHRKALKDTDSGH